ncbi:MAG TPA: hypothetical protein PLN48_02750 [Lachnospiraceae bacterium]|nr:hypothetical protein [Lachnospiraceae bacterium]
MLADEDRVRAMIGLTRYENGSGKEALRLRKYYRTDYLALELIKTFFLATIAYFLILTLLIAGNAEYLLDHVNSMDIRLAGSYILIGYIVFMGIYLAITYIRAIVRYGRAKKSVREYENKLHSLKEASREKDPTESLMELFDMGKSK